MNKEFERYIIVILFVILLLTGLSGCAKPKVNTEGLDKNKVPTELETIGKLEAIGTVIGCMFDPKPCEEKRKELENEENK